MRYIISTVMTVMTLCFYAAPAPGACPSAMGALLLDSASSSGKFYQYQVAMRGLGSGPISLRLDVVDNGVQKGSLFAASLNPDQGALELVFYWPTATVNAVRLHDLPEVRSGIATSCPALSAQILDPVPVQSTWSFDDHGLVAAAEMPLLQTQSAPLEKGVPPPVITKVKPQYSFADRERDIEGTVVIGIAIGPSGHVLNAWVAHSSGHKSLDDSAVAAARSSTFLGFQAGGKPIVRTFFDTYTFSAD